MSTPMDSTAPRPGFGHRLGVLAYGVAGYLVFQASLLYLIAFVAGFPLPLTVDRPVTGLPLPAALAVDMALIALFGVQHSVMARPGFKRWWTRLVPQVAERSTYLFATGAVLLPVYLFWQPLPGTVWELESAAARGLVWALFALGLGVGVAATFAIDHFELFGLRQVWAHFRGRTFTPPAFKTPRLYRVVRHPMQLGMLVLLWAAPTLTVGRALFASGMTLYVLVALVFEERDLVRTFGDRYRMYRLRVPKLIPGLHVLRRRSRRVVEVALVLAGLTAVFLLAGRALAVGVERAEAAVAGERSLERATVQVGGLERSFAFHAPVRLAPRPALVVVFHGNGGSAERIRTFTGRGFERLADEHGFVVAYPEGYEGGWNDCRARAPYPARKEHVDDHGFFREIVRRLESELGLGPDGFSAVFATGFSNGGHLALRLALEHPEEVDGVAVFGANLPVADQLDCERSGQPVPVLLVNGTKDRINPYAGGTAVHPKGDALGDVISAQATAAYFAGLADLPPAPSSIERLPESDGDPETWVKRATWSAPGKPAVSLVTVRGGGHTIPQGAFVFPALVGRTSTEVDGPREAWSFFARQLRAAGVGLRGVRSVVKPISTEEEGHGDSVVEEADPGFGQARDPGSGPAVGRAAERLEGDADRLPREGRQ